MIRVNPLPQNVGEWLSTWQTWLDGQYPNQGVNSGPASIYIDDYYAPPKEGHIPDAPSAYAIFGTTAIPLLLTIAYYINPLPVPLARADIRGLTTDAIQALAANGIITVDQVVGAWTTLIADITGESLEYSNCLISDSIETAEKINTTRSYYEGLDEEVADILRQMALSDDVALANADQRELATQLNSKGFAIRLIAQAREAIPAEHWSLDALKLKKEQVQTLQKIGISSKGELLARAETNKGHQELQRVLGLSSQAIDDLHTNIYAQMTASSLTLARIKDLVLLPNVNAVIASQLADAEIDSVQEVASTDKTILMEITRISEDAAEDLKHEARHARAEGLEVVHLASVTKEVADALNDVLGIKTIEHLSKASEEKVIEVFKRFHGDRAVNFVNALFDGIRGADK
jgi:diphthamide synthase (EF-2-diphthine--ammonia ligase)